MLKRLVSAWIPEPSALLARTNHPRFRNPPWPLVALGLGVLAGAVAWPFGVYAFLARTGPLGVSHAHALPTLLVILLLPALESVAFRQGVVRTPLYVRLALTLVALALAEMLTVRLRYAPAADLDHGLRPGILPVLGGFEGVALGVVFPVAFVACTLALRGAWVARGTWLTMASRVAVSLSLALVVASTARGLIRGGTGDGLSSLSERVTLPALSFEDDALGADGWRGERSYPDLTRRYRRQVGDVTVRASCGGDDWCAYSLTRGGGEVSERQQSYVSRGQQLVLHRDPSRGLVALEAGGRIRLIARGARLVQATRADFAPWLTIPWGWTICAALGLAVAALAMANRRERFEVYERPESWREATITEGGWLRFADGAPPRLAAASIAEYRGPVVVLPTDRHGDTSYRDDGGPRDGWVVAGTIPALREAVESARASVDALALAAAVLTAAPLYAALLAGMLTAW